MRAAVERAGLDVRPVAVDAEGMGAGRVPAGAAAVVTPAHQFPTGALLSERRRAELLERAAFIVEDDRGGELRHDGRAALFLDDTTDVLALAPFTVVDRPTRPVLDLSHRGARR